jgi:hypothetical protein
VKKEDLLAYVGIALSIPGVVLLFSDKAAIGILVLVLVIILLTIYSLLNRPVFTYMDVEKILEFHDELGQLAIQTSTFKARANHKGITQLWFRNINADGSIQNIKIDGKLVDTQAIGKVAGSIAIFKQFDHELTRGQVAPVELSYELHGSFLNSREGVTHITATQTKKVKMLIKFHQKRPVRAARHYLGYGGQVHVELEKPVVSNNGLSVECEFKNPKPGSYHTVEWDW